MLHSQSPAARIQPEFPVSHTPDSHQQAKEGDEIEQLAAESRASKGVQPTTRQKARVFWLKKDVVFFSCFEQAVW